MTIFVPAEPFAPGEYIRDEIEARGWTQDDLADVMGISRRQVINLIQGKSGITPDTAHALAEAFPGQDARTWMNLQISFELAMAAKNERGVKRRACIFSKAPIREIKRRGWIPDVDDTDDLEKAVCNLLRIRNIEDEPEVLIAAKKSTPYDSDTSAQIAWYRRAWELAEHAPSARYDEGQFEEGLKALLQLAAYPEDARRIPSTLADMGIRLILNEHLKATKIDGAAFWLDDSTPAIALSLRYDRIDNLWHTLMHELMHIRHRHAAPVDIDMMSHDVPELERTTNEEAAGVLIAKEKLASFVNRVKPYFYQARVNQFAQVHKVHPGIVVGQLQYRGEITHQQLRKLLPKVRSEIIGSTVTDGWGNKPSF